MRRIVSRSVCFIMAGLALLCLEMSTRETLNTDGAISGKHNEENGSGGIGKDRFAMAGDEIWSPASSSSVADGGIGVEPAYAAAPEPIFLSSSLPEDLDHGLDRDQYEEGGEMVGETINILNGNMVDVRTDLSFPSPHRLGFRFEAVYNSRSAASRTTGYGWTHTYDARANGAGGSGFDLKIIDETGRAHYFVKEEGVSGVYVGKFQERTRVTVSGEQYIWFRLDGGKYRFSTTTGKLLYIADALSNGLDLNYDAQGRLGNVRDVATGRTITFTYNARGLIQEIQGPVTTAVSNGKWVEYGYDAADNLISVRYADGSGFSYQYQDLPADPHRLWRKRNKLAHLIESWNYDDQDRCTAKFNNEGKGVGSIAYASDTRVDVTANGKLRSYTIATAGGRRRVVAMSGPSNALYSRTNAIGWIYDAQMRLSEVTFGGGTVNRYQNFESRGFPRTIILAYGSPEQRTITYTYHPALSAPLSRTEASVLGSANKVTVWDYDSPRDPNDDPNVYNQNPTRLVYRVIETGNTLDLSGSIVPYTYITALGYNAKGQLTVYDPPSAKADRIQLAYDDTATCNLVSIIQPIVGSTRFPLASYDLAGFPLQMIDINGKTTDFAFDGRARLTRITHSDASSRSIAYDRGAPRTLTDEDAVSQTFDYDSSGRLNRITDQEQNRIDYEYDGMGNVISAKYLNAQEVLTRWKRWSHQNPSYPGLLWKEILAEPYDGTSSIYEFNGAGAVRKVTDFNGNVTDYAYDALNRPKTITQPGGVVSGFTYDRHGNLKTLTDGEGHQTVYTHDDMGRVVRVQSPDTGTTTYVYDALGMRWKTDAKGIVSTYSYDALFRLTGVSFPEANGQSGYSITYTYDQRTNGKGHLTDITDPTGSTRFDYDSRGRLQVKTSRINDKDFVISRIFTPGGRVMQITTPTGRTVDYERSTGCACRVSRITTKGALEATATALFEISSYLPFGSPSDMDTGNGGSISNVFDLNGRLSISNPGAPKERQYTYYANGSLQSITALGAPWQNRTYTYDPLNQLRRAQGPYGSLDYTYDKARNRVTFEGQAYEYVEGTNRISGDPAWRGYDYDPNGNIIGIEEYPQSRSLTYNQNSELVKVREGARVLGEYTYNGLGQRVIKKTQTTTYYVYDFDGNLIAESYSDGRISDEHLYYGRTRLAKADWSKAIFLYHNDEFGTPQFMTDQLNMVVWEAIYYPFGEAVVHARSSVKNNFRFQGQYFDAETGFHYNYHRYYDPKIGRYLTPDPIGLAGGINPYVYVLNDPVNLVDPLGLYPGQHPPPLPGYNPDSWNPRWDRGFDGWTVTDPETGNDWTLHPEDSGHWRHWDNQNTGQSYPPNKKKPNEDQSPCDPSGDAPEWHPPIDEFSTLDRLGRIVPGGAPFTVFPMPGYFPGPTSVNPVFVPGFAY